MKWAPTDEEFNARIAEYNRSEANGGTPTKPAAIISMETGARLDNRTRARTIPIVAFDQIKLSTERRYLVKGIVPREGLCVIWGPPKCGKSFWVFDLSMHIALGWPYRGRRVQAGAVVYGAFEGSHGFGARIEAFRQKFLAEASDPVPFFLEPLTINLVREHQALIAAIRENLGDVVPAAVVLDTLNRSLQGSESSDEDMTAYIRASDAIREAFKCAVIIVHHCGVDGTRPRGHTSLTGAVDAQLAVKRDLSGTIEVKVEWMKDGPEGDLIASRLETLDVGIDEDGEAIASCFITPTEIKDRSDTDGRLSKNQTTMFSILHDAGPAGLSSDEWNERARTIGLGVSRRSDLYDLRSALKAKGRIRQKGEVWTVNHDG